MNEPSPSCARHPDVETRLRCWSCDDRICPRCANDAPTGYVCPDCAHASRPASADGAAPTPRGVSMFRRGPRSQERPGTSPGAVDGRLPTAIGVKATVVGLAASVAGGLLLGPVLIGGTLFLLSAGVIGWGVARAVYWASDERTSPYLRAVALTLAGFAVAIGLVTAGTQGAASGGLLFLAYPAAMYGGWIVVRQR